MTKHASGAERTRAKAAARHQKKASHPLKTIAELRIGDPVWMFDSNRRQFTKPEKGRLYGTVIWRHHWAPYEVVGDNSRSWLIGHPRPGEPYVIAKIPKSGKFVDGRLRRQAFCFSEAEIDEREWVNEHRMEIARKVERCYSADTLRQIERLADDD